MNHPTSHSSLDAAALIQLIRQMNHDLRSPINIILSTTDLLLDGAYEPLGAEQTQAVGRVKHGASRLMAVIEYMMLYIRVLSGDYPIDITAAEPRLLIDRCFRTVGDFALRRKLSLDSSISPDLPSQIYTDQDVFERILTELLWNATGFTTQGGVKVSAYIDPTDSQRWCVDVADSGNGVAEKILPALFQPFFRGSRRGGSTPTPNTGLGLALVKALAGRINGDVVLKSTGETGATFTLILPIADTVTSA